MNSKNVTILCIIFAVLLTGVAVKKLVRPEIPTMETDVDIIETKLDASNVFDLWINAGTKEVHLARVNDRWVVRMQNDVPAENDRINRIIQALDSLGGDLRSTGKDLFDDYGITDEQGVRLKLHTATAPDINLVFGTERPGYGKNFVRHEGSPAVYTTQADILSALGFVSPVNEISLQADAWADKTVIRFDPEKVQQMTLSKNDKKWFDLIQESIQNQKQWKFAQVYSFPVDSLKVENFIKYLPSLRGNSVVVDSTVTVPNANEWNLVLLFNDGKKTQIDCWKKEDSGEYYIKSSDTAYALLISDQTIQTLAKTDGDFFISNPLHVDDAKIMGMEINDKEDKKKFVLQKSSEAKTPDGTNEQIIWKLGNGGIVSPEQIQIVLDQLKKITFKTFAEIPQSLDSTLAFGITDEQNVSQKYEITKGVQMTDSQTECHFFKVPNDTASYCVSNDWLSSFKSSLPTSTPSQETTKK